MRGRAVLLAVLGIVVVLELAFAVIALVGGDGDKGAAPSATPTVDQTDGFTFTPRPDTSPRLQQTASPTPTGPTGAASPTAGATPTPGASPTAQATTPSETIALTGPVVANWIGFVPLFGGIGLAVALRRLR